MTDKLAQCFWHGLYLALYVPQFSGEQNKEGEGERFYHKAPATGRFVQRLDSLSVKRRRH